MSCDWQTKLDPYVDGELAPTELAELESHLRVCPDCSAHAVGRMKLKRMVHAAGNRYAPSTEFRLKIQNLVEKQKHPHRRWAAGWIPQLALAAAALIIILAGAGLWRQRSQQQTMLAELADLHVSTLASANPVDVVSSDKHTVKPWFQGKLPFSFNLPELKDSPFKLVGGRVAYLQQNPGAHLLFQIRKHEISVFIFPDRPELSRLAAGLSTAKKVEFTVQSWSQGGLRYFAVGDADPNDIHALCELLEKAG